MTAVAHHDMKAQPGGGASRNRIQERAWRTESAGCSKRTLRGGLSTAHRERAGCGNMLVTLKSHHDART